MEEKHGFVEIFLKNMFFYEMDKLKSVLMSIDDGIKKDNH